MAAETGQYTNGDAVDIIVNEGIGYAVQEYVDGNEFKDPRTAEMWTAAATVLNDLVSYLERETGRTIY